MMLVALLMRPWMLVMPHNNVTPRTLADDLLFISHGHDHLQQTITATDATHDYLRCIGAKVATHKSILFSSCDTARQQLRKHTWAYDGCKIQVSNNFRDLGAYINMTGSAHSTTLNERMDLGTFVINIISRLPLTHSQKAHIIRTKGIPMSIYGAEASKPNETKQRCLATAIKNCVSNTVLHKDSNLTYITSSHGPDIDVETHILINRILMLRRALAKRPELETIAKHNLGL